MKKVLLLLVFVCGITSAQVINIPDANFKAALLSASSTNTIADDDFSSSVHYVPIDTNNDGEIQVSEALAIAGLVIPNMSINSLQGITSFTNLRDLYCYNNQLTSLNLTGLNYLTNLNCSGNQISTLNLNGLSNLSLMYVENNQLTSLDLNSFSSLKYVRCGSNLLTSINVSGLSGLRDLQCNNNFLTSLNLTGCSSLQTLYCYVNQITTLNAAALSNLQYLWCQSNQLSTLNVAGLSNLISLVCSSNQLTSLDLTNLIHLDRLSCQNNQITSLDVNNLTTLTYLGCSSNQLSSLYVPNLLNLTHLAFDYNMISSVDVSTLVNLTDLATSNNPYTTLDVSNLTRLTNMNLGGPNFISLYMKNGKNEGIGISASPNLAYICADESQVASVQNVVNTTIGVNHNAVVSSYCSFVPGGNYNKVAGVVRFDADNNGCSASDATIPNIVRLDLTSGAVTSGVFANTDGSYALYAATGTYTLSTSLENPAYFSISPAVATFTFPTLNNSTQTQNLCLTATGIHPDVEVFLVPLMNARPGFDTYYELLYRNKGNQILSGDVNLTFEDNKMDFVSASPIANTQALNTVGWNYANLLPFETRRIQLVFNINSPTETPAVNMGDPLNYSATINPISGDETTADNTFVFTHTTNNSLDPNEKTCLEGNSVSPTEIGDYLHYVINFENIGTAAAINVVVNDIIDTTKYDISTLRILDSSYPAVVKVTGNKVEFIFEGINLGALEHGNVVFKIKTKSSLVAGNTVSNKANIFFDYNSPIATNTATTIFQLLSNQEFKADESVSVYPNPGTDEVNVRSEGIIKSVQLFDVQGRVMMASQVGEPEVKLDVSAYSNGVYFLKVITDRGIKTEKLMKE